MPYAPQSGDYILAYWHRDKRRRVDNIEALKARASLLDIDNYALAVQDICLEDEPVLVPAMRRSTRAGPWGRTARGAAAHRGKALAVSGRTPPSSSPSLWRLHRSDRGMSKLSVLEWRPAELVSILRAGP